MREQILKEIRRLAEANGGEPPGSSTFRRETGIGDGEWLGHYWARWSDAVAEAGFKPNQPPERIDDTAMFAKLIDAIRHFQRIPTIFDNRLYRKNIDPEFPASTLERRFGNRALMLKQFSGWITSRRDCEDIEALLTRASVEADTTPTSQVKEGHVYLLRSGPNYKIGRSEELERRVKNITVALPDATQLVHAIRTDDPPGIEAYWHRRFADRRIRPDAEWFKLTASDVAAFKRRKFQ